MSEGTYRDLLKEFPGAVIIGAGVTKRALTAMPRKRKDDPATPEDESLEDEPEAAEPDPEEDPPAELDPEDQADGPVLPTPPAPKSILELGSHG